MTWHPSHYSPTSKCRHEELKCIVNLAISSIKYLQPLEVGHCCTSFPCQTCNKMKKKINLKNSIGHYQKDICCNTVIPALVITCLQRPLFLPLLGDLYRQVVLYKKHFQLNFNLYFLYFVYLQYMPWYVQGNNPYIFFVILSLHFFLLYYFSHSCFVEIIFLKVSSAQLKENCVNKKKERQNRMLVEHKS